MNHGLENNGPFEKEKHMSNFFTAEQVAWGRKMADQLKEKMPYALKKALDVDGIPYTVEGDAWVPAERGITWWTNGFWPALMWRMYLLTEDNAYRLEATRAEEMMDGAFQKFEVLHHDVGFQWRISAGVQHALTGNPASYRRMEMAYRLLASRFNPNGFIRAWNGEERPGWSIIDTMMNLPLLYWASEQTHDPRFRLMACRHADMVLRNFFRPDGSVNHIVIYDPENGQVLDTPRGQGYAPGSSWSRGQGWALYGFAISFRHTGRQEYLDASRRVADYYLSHMPADFISPCDFAAPAEPVVKDNCAGCIAACGLMELANQLPGDEGKPYAQAAVQLLQAMEQAGDLDFAQVSPAVVKRCSVAYHTDTGRHIYMNYADYYFAEAVARLVGENTFFW